MGLAFILYSFDQTTLLEVFEAQSGFLRKAILESVLTLVTGKGDNAFVSCPCSFPIYVQILLIHFLL